ncbi:hypothetical protein [Mycolicibacterium mageritense]|nr:hypothetical protein [Mycolicibacterium mageritense]
MRSHLAAIVLVVVFAIALGVVVTLAISDLADDIANRTTPGTSMVTE